MSEPSHEERNWAREVRLAGLYRALSDVEAGSVRQILFLELGHRALEQAGLWRTEARKRGRELPEGPPAGGVPRGLASGLRWLGPEVMAASLHRAGLRGLVCYPRRVSLRISACSDGALVAASLLIVTAASGGGSGEQWLVAGVGTLAGVAGLGWIGARTARRRAAPGLPQVWTGDDLVGVLLSQGLTPAEAEAGAAHLRADPDAALRQRWQALFAPPPRRMPPPAGAAWSLAGAYLSGALPVWFLAGHPRAVVVTTVLLCALAGGWKGLCRRGRPLVGALAGAALAGCALATLWVVARLFVAP